MPLALVEADPTKPAELPVMEQQAIEILADGLKTFRARIEREGGWRPHDAVGLGDIAMLLAGHTPSQAA